MYKYILVLISLFLVGCAPVYITKNQYIAPKDSQFTQRVSICEVEKKTCASECRNDYQICLNSAHQRAKGIFDIQLKRYDIEYERYVVDLRDFQYYKYDFDKTYMQIEQDYNYFYKECHKKKKNYACSRQDELRDSLHMMKRDRLREPKEPRKPYFNHILRLEQKSCSNQCGCSKSFDICYVNSGGEVIPRKFCIKNCE